MARKIGFTNTGLLTVSALRFLPEVRDMCKADLCHNYGKCWTCPPYCGSLEEISEKISIYSTGVLVQSTGQMEDDFDVECMAKIQGLQKKRFKMIVKRLKEEGVSFLPMSSGECKK